MKTAGSATARPLPMNRVDRILELLRVDSFREAIAATGLTPPDDIHADGQLHRFPTNGRRDDDSGWYVLHADGVPAGVFGDWRSGLKETWCAKSDRQMTPAERAAHRQRIETIQRDREAEEQRRHAEATAEAQRIWDAATPASDAHLYLQRKQVQAHGLRLDDEGDLLLPIRINGAISSLQFIDADGKKLFLYGGAKKGGSFTIGSTTNPVVLCVCEGYATGASLHEATGLPVVMAFDAGNLESVARAIREEFPAAKIMLCADNDIRDDGTPNTGVVSATAAAKAIGGLLAIPEMGGAKCDFNDVHARYGLDAVRNAIEAAQKRGEEHAGPEADNSFRAYRPDPLHTSNFKPLQASELLAEVPEPTEWILEDYLATGSLGLIAGKPKEGKTTLVYELAVKVTQGLPFLGRTTQQGGVLILAVEEHRRDVKMRLQNLGAEGLDGLYIHIGALSPTPTFFTELLVFIRDHKIRLVIIDTLAAFWNVDNENDASEMTKAVKPLLRLARDSGACVLLVHHARKSEGSHGDEIRGSGALFGLVDVALVMKRHSVENQRLLQAQSRYPETPSELVLELREAGYVALGDPASVGKAAKKQQLIQALSEDWEKAESITKRAGLTRRVGYRLLDLLVEEGMALREGQGKKSDPYRFKKNSIRAAPPLPAQTELGGMEPIELFEEAPNAT